MTLDPTQGGREREIGRLAVLSFVKKVRSRAMRIAEEMHKKHGGPWTSNAHLDEAIQDVLKDRTYAPGKEKP